MPFSPLGRGFLTEAVTGRVRITPGDWRENNRRFTDENLARNRALREPLERIAQAHGRTPAQVALAWVLSQGSQVIPIPGMKRRGHLDEDVAAVDIELTPEDLAHLEAEFPPGTAAGDGYTPEVARWAGR